MTKVILITGDERFLVEQKLSEFCSNLSFPELNLENIDIENEGEDDVIDRLYQVPFADEKRIIVIHGDVFSKNYNRLTKYCSNPDSDTTVLILVVDKEDRRTKLFKAISANGLVLTFNRLKEKQFLEFIRDFFQRNGLTLTDDLCNYISQRSGYLLSDEASLQTLVQSFTNIILSGKPLTEDTVNAYVKPFLNTNVFSLTKHIGNGDINKALCTINELIESGVEELQIFGLIRRHYRILYKLSTGIRPEDIGLSPFMLGEFKNECERTSPARVSAYLDKVQTMYSYVRRGQISTRLGIETLLVQLAIEGGSLA